MVSIMSEININSDLLKCENNYFIEENKVNSLLITKNSKKNAFNCHLKAENGFKTERISSKVLIKAKDFLSKIKSNTNESDEQMCDLVTDESNECPNDGKPMIEMNFMLFEDKHKKAIQSSDEEESDSDQSIDSSTEDSEEESSGLDEDIKTDDKVCHKITEETIE